MQLDELQDRLGPFCEEKYGAGANIFDVVKMPGHAGFAYGFRVEQGGEVESWFIRLPPPNVNWRGTADVLRQVEVLNALDGTDVPHCSVKWSGDDLQWFDCPYFVVPWLEGDVLRIGPHEWGAALSDHQLHDLGRQAMTALAHIHRVDPATTPYLGEPVPFEEDVMRWDRLFERAADPECLKDAPVVRQKLLDKLPSAARVGIFHGDFQNANLFCSTNTPKVLAVIDWELTGIGATLNDVGWMVTFSDPQAWAPERGLGPMFLDPETLIDLYNKAMGEAVPDIDWFRALAAYKFASITGFNLSLHRRGKRPDPTWEITAKSMTPLIDRANELLG
ncbi:MAG: phosphotransferase family protein [Gammaproteobacteria bacterium]|nr:phosphotransferase family protein [Gammaproteobacteria bacterium]